MLQVVGGPEAEDRMVGLRNLVLAGRTGEHGIR